MLISHNQGLSMLISHNQGSVYSPYLYDAVYLYCLLINQTLGEGGNISDGRRLFELTDGLTFVSREYSSPRSKWRSKRGC